MYLVLITRNSFAPVLHNFLVNNKMSNEGVTVES